MSTRRRLVRSAGLGTGAVAVFVGLFVTFGVSLQHNAIDERTAAAAHRAATAHPDLATAARGVTQLGSIWTLLAVTVVATAALARHRRIRSAVVVVIVWGGCQAIVAIAKVASGRARPVFTDPVYTATGYAFPSGHAANSTAVYGTVLVAVVPLLAARWRVWLGVVVGLLVLAIASSRVVLGVHWLSDAIGGLVLGVACVRAAQLSMRPPPTARLPQSGGRSEVSSTGRPGNVS